MNEKSSCPHRLESLLAQRYPIFVGQLFDDGLLALRARDERPQQSEQCRAGLVVLIGIELAQPGLLFYLARPDDGRLRHRVDCTSTLLRVENVCFRTSIYRCWL